MWPLLAEKANNEPPNPFFLLILLLDGYSFANVHVKGPKLYQTLLHSHSPNEVPPKQQNVSIAVVQGTVHPSKLFFFKHFY